MIKLRYQWLPLLLTIFLIPLRYKLSLPQQDGSIWQHMFYMFIHANFLHWFCNCAAWFTLWCHVTWRRLSFAYLSAVLIGYTMPYVHIPFIEESERVCGFSVVIFWFIGLVMPTLSSGKRLRLIMLVFLSLFIPGIAASYHIAALCLGLTYNLCRRLRPAE